MSGTPNVISVQPTNNSEAISEESSDTKMDVTKSEESNTQSRENHNKNDVVKSEDKKTAEQKRQEEKEQKNEPNKPEVKQAPTNSNQTIGGVASTQTSVKPGGQESSTQETKKTGDKKTNKKMGCESLAKCFLVSFNMMFLMFGGGCLAGGIYIIVAKDDILVLARSATGSLDTSDLDVPSLIEYAAYTLIGAGSFIVVVAFLGCCGACLQNKKMLIAYVIIVGGIFLIEVAAVVMAIIYQDQFDSYAKDNLKTIQTDRYIGPYDTSDVVSMAFDAVQILFKCCGIENGGDYASYTKWNTTYAYDNGGGYVTATAVIPATCCEFSNSDAFPNDMTGFLNSMTDKQCPVNKASSYYNTGCYQSIKDRLMQYMNIVIGVGAAVAALEIVGIICACCLMKKGKIENEKNVKV